jgi:hypothetical protein
LKATVRKVRTLTGEILYPKPTGYRPQRIFQNGFPNYEAPSPKRHCPSSMDPRLSPFSWRRSPVNAPVPIGGMAVPNEPAGNPNFSAVFPIAPMIFPNFPATFPNFSPADIISNGLFPSHLCGFQALNRQNHN